MSKLILAITGPAGSGKSTIGERVAKNLERCVSIDADHVKHMIVSGFYEDSTVPGGGGFTEWELVGDSIGVLAANFNIKGYAVVINGYLDKEAWSSLEKRISVTHKVLLLPELKTIIDRDAGRSKDDAMGAEAVAEHHDSFSTDSFYTTFQKLDTTNHTADETLTEVLRLVG